MYLFDMYKRFKILFIVVVILLVVGVFSGIMGMYGSPSALWPILFALTLFPAAYLMPRLVGSYEEELEEEKKIEGLYGKKSV